MECKDDFQVVGAPRYFGHIWKMLKGWLDPVTAAKIDIVDNDDVARTLNQYIDVENIPKQFGGSFAFEHGMLPNPDVEIRKLLDTVLPEGVSLAGPFKWVDDGSGKRSVVPVGTVKGMRRDDSVRKTNVL